VPSGVVEQVRHGLPDAFLIHVERRGGRGGQPQLERDVEGERFDVAG
jgi:hypothetical protein